MPVTIRELVNEYGLTLFALRHHERLGLITSIRGLRNRRCYSDQTALRVRTIAELSAMGLPLAEIKELVAEDAAVPRDRIEAMVKRFMARRDELTSRIDRLRAYR